MSDTAKFNWWWRVVSQDKAFPGNPVPDIMYLVFKKSWERAAFLYELEKRITGKYEFDKAFIMLSREQIEVIAQRWYMPHHYVCSTAKEKGWAGWAFIGHSWNLNLPDKTLLRQFQIYIRQERKKLKIKTPGRNAGTTRRRPISWRTIELMDLRADGKVLNESERSQVSKARRLWKSYQSK